jgi:hypothetical protein
MKRSFGSLLERTLTHKLQTCCRDFVFMCMWVHTSSFNMSYNISTSVLLFFGPILDSQWENLVVSGSESIPAESWNFSPSWTQ